MGMDKPSVQYVDSAYISASKLVKAQGQGRELIGPALPGPKKDGRLTLRNFKSTSKNDTRFVPPEKLIPVQPPG